MYGLYWALTPCLIKCYLPLWTQSSQVGVSASLVVPISRSWLWRMLSKCCWNKWVSDWKYYCTDLLLHTSGCRCEQRAVEHFLPWRPRPLSFGHRSLHTPFHTRTTTHCTPPCFQLAIVQHFWWHSQLSSLPSHHCPRSPNCLSLPNNAQQLPFTEYILCGRSFLCKTALGPHNSSMSRSVTSYTADEKNEVQRRSVTSPREVAEM